MSVIARLFLPSFQRKPTAYMDSCSISVPSEKPEVGSLSVYNYIIIYIHIPTFYSACTFILGYFEELQPVRQATVYLISFLVKDSSTWMDAWLQSFNASNTGNRDISISYCFV